MTDLVRLLADVQAAVEAAGRMVTVTTYSDAYNEATGKTTRTEQSYSVLASPPYGQARGMTTDSQPRGSAQMIVPASAVTFALRPGQKVSTGGRHYTITVVGRLELKDQLIAYELTLQEGSA